VRDWSTHWSTSFSTSRCVCHSSFSCYWRILLFLIGIGRTASITIVRIEGIWRIFEGRLPIGLYSGYSVLTQEKFERCVLSDMKIRWTSVSPSQSVAVTSISTLLPSSISAYLCLPLPVRSVHFGIDAVRYCITVKPTLRGVNEMLGVGWLPHKPSHAFDDVSNPVFDSAWVTFIASHILESVAPTPREPDDLAF